MVHNLENTTISSADYNVSNSSCDEDNCTTVDPQTTIIIENTEPTTLNITETPNVTTTISPQNDKKSPVSNTSKKKHSLFSRRSSCDCDLMVIFFYYFELIMYISQKKYFSYDTNTGNVFGSFLNS